MSAQRWNIRNSLNARTTTWKQFGLWEKEPEHKNKRNKSIIWAITLSTTVCLVIFTFWDITRKYHGSLRNIYCTTLYVTMNLKFLNFWLVFAELYHPCITRWVSRKPEKSIPNTLFCDTKIVVSLARTLCLSSWKLSSFLHIFWLVLKYKISQRRRQDNVHNRCLFLYVKRPIGFTLRYARSDDDQRRRKMWWDH